MLSDGHRKIQQRLRKSNSSPQRARRTQRKTLTKEKTRVRQYVMNSCCEVLVEASLLC